MQRPTLWTRLLNSMLGRVPCTTGGAGRATFRPCLGELEDRVVPAGNVNTFFDAKGNFVIEGDDEANDITITQNVFGDGSIAIQGNNGTKLNGRDDPIAEDVTNRNVIIRMKGGDDVVNITGDIKFDRIFRVDLGTGNTKLTGGSGKLAVTEDFVIVHRAKKGEVANKEVSLAKQLDDVLEVGGNFTFRSGGISNDDFKMGAGEIGGDFNFFRGQGIDDADIFLTRMQNGIIEDLKAANDTNIKLEVDQVLGDLNAKLRGKNTTLEVIALQVDGAMKVNVQSQEKSTVNVIIIDQVKKANIRTGSGDDSGGITIVKVNEVTDNLVIANTGKSQSTVVTGTKVGGDVTINHKGSALSATIFEEVEVNGLTKLVGSDLGIDSFSLIASILNNLDIIFGKGSDFLSLGQGLFGTPSQQTTINGPANIKMGGGNDTITLGGSAPEEKVTFGGFPQGVNLNGGKGFDTVQTGNIQVNDPENFKKVSIEQDILI